MKAAAAAGKYRVSAPAGGSNNDRETGEVAPRQQRYDPVLAPQLHTPSQQVYPTELRWPWARLPKRSSPRPTSRPPARPKHRLGRLAQSPLHAASGSPITMVEHLIAALRVDRRSPWTRRTSVVQPDTPVREPRLQPHRGASPASPARCRSIDTPLPVSVCRLPSAATTSRLTQKTLVACCGRGRGRVSPLEDPGAGGCGGYRTLSSRGAKDGKRFVSGQAQESRTAQCGQTPDGPSPPPPGRS